MPLASAQGDDVEEEADYEADMDGGLFKLMPALGVDMPIGTNVWRLSSSVVLDARGRPLLQRRATLASRSGRSGQSPRKALAPAQGNADAPPDLAPLAPAQCLTSEQQARIEENRAAALAKRRAKSKAKSNAKAQARRTASSLYETLEEDIGGEEDITVGEEDITVEGAVVPAPQSRGPISDREMAERDAAERPQCVICQDFF